MVSRAGRAGRSGRAGARGRGRGGPRWAGGALGEARPRAGGLGGGVYAAGEGQPGRGRGFGRRVCSGGPRPRVGVLCPLSCGEIRTKEEAGGGGRFAGSGCLPPPPVPAGYRGPQFRAPGRPLGSSGCLGIFKINGGGGRPSTPRVVRRAPGVRGGSAGPWRRLAPISQVGKLRTGRSVWCRSSFVGGDCAAWA